MEDDFKLRYACPRCGTRVRTESGHCSNCGFIGQMQHKDIRLRDIDAYGRTVTVDPPTTQEITRSRKSCTTLSSASHYRCPRCGARTARAFGRCPNHRSCGYVGAMKTWMTLAG